MSIYFSSALEQIRIIPEFFFASERLIRETFSIINEKRVTTKENTRSRIVSLFISYLASPNTLFFGLSLRLISLSCPSPDLAITIDFLASLTLLGATVKFRDFLSTFSDFSYSLAQPGFVGAALRGDKKAGVLISTLEGPNTHLSKEEIWLKKAFNGDHLFKSEEFQKLNKYLKRKIYFVANAFGNRKLVEKLNSLEMAKDPMFSSGPHILARNMDIIMAENTTKNWLKQLRKKELLLTQAEFNERDKKTYLSKGNDISRIYGRDFVQRLISDHGLKHIKVPEKIAVIRGKPENLTFRIHPSSVDPIIDGDQIEVQAEYIKAERRKLSLEEAIEYAFILEITGYNDFSGQNFILAVDGIYFIDTESKNFTPEEPNFEVIENIQNKLNPEDVEVFMQKFNERKKAFLSKKPILEDSREKYRSFFRESFNDLVCGTKHLKFTIEIASLFA